VLIWCELVCLFALEWRQVGLDVGAEGVSGHRGSEGSTGGHEGRFREEIPRQALLRERHVQEEGRADSGPPSRRPSSPRRRRYAPTERGLVRVRHRVAVVVLRVLVVVYGWDVQRREVVADSVHRISLSTRSRPPSSRRGRI